MAHTEARAWWDDVQHLRDAYERTDEARRRADRADEAARSVPRDRGDHGESEPRMSAATAAPRHPTQAHSPSRRADDLGAPPLRARFEPGAGFPARRTVEIRGRTVPAPAVPRTIEIDRRRPARRPVERVHPHPDRLALWALLMGLLLILVAIGTAGASPLGL